MHILAPEEGTCGAALDFLLQFGPDLQVRIGHCNEPGICSTGPGHRVRSASRSSGKARNRPRFLQSLPLNPHGALDSKFLTQYFMFVSWGMESCTLQECTPETKLIFLDIRFHNRRVSKTPTAKLKQSLVHSKNPTSVWCCTKMSHLGYFFFSDSRFLSSFYPCVCNFRHIETHIDSLYSSLISKLQNFRHSRLLLRGATVAQEPPLSLGVPYCGHSSRSGACRNVPVFRSGKSFSYCPSRWWGPPRYGGDSPVCGGECCSSELCCVALHNQHVGLSPGMGSTPGTGHRESLVFCIGERVVCFRFVLQDHPWRKRLQAVAIVVVLLVRAFVCMRPCMGVRACSPLSELRWGVAQATRSGRHFALLFAQEELRQFLLHFGRRDRTCEQNTPPFHTSDAALVMSSAWTTSI